MGIDEVPGDESDQAASRAWVFHISHPFELLLRASEIADSVDELLDARVDETENRNADHCSVDPTGHLFAGTVHDGEAYEKEEGKGDEEPQDVVTWKSRDFPQFHLLVIQFVVAHPAHPVQPAKDSIENGEPDFVQQLKDQNDDPAGGKNRNDGCHPREKGFHSPSNPGMPRFSRLADLIVWMF